MQQCPNCKHQNRAGIVFCENCGASLIGKLPVDTKSLESSSEDEKAQLGIDSSVLTDVKVQGRAVFEEGASLQLEVEGSPEAILFKPKPETIFGRRDPATGAMPDIDLTPFAGYRMGVSRRHAAIRHGDDQSLDLWDLGSSNGTFLNGQRLSAHRPYRLHDGDELRLGQMVIRLYFKAGVEVPETTTLTEADITRPAARTLADTEAKPAEPVPSENVASQPEQAKSAAAEAPITSPVDPKQQPTTTNLSEVELEAKITEEPKVEEAAEKPKEESPSAPPDQKTGEASAAATEVPKTSELSPEKAEKPDSPATQAPPSEQEPNALPPENGKQRDSA